MSRQKENCQQGQAWPVGPEKTEGVEIREFPTELSRETPALPLASSRSKARTEQVSVRTMQVEVSSKMPRNDSVETVHTPSGIAE